MKLKNFSSSAEGLNKTSEIKEQASNDINNIEDKERSNNNDDSDINNEFNEPKENNKKQKYNSDLFDKQDKIGSKTNPYTLKVEEFKDRFLALNKNLNENDYKYAIRKFKGKKYINFVRLDDINADIPHGECIGKTMLKKKIYSKTPLGYFKYNNKPIPYYDLNALDADILGFVMVEDNKYILITKRHKTIIDFAVMVIVIIYAISLIF